jgi:ketosteroid isomerase-like protein
VSDLIAPPAARSPAEAVELVAVAVSDGDLEAAATLYEPGAALAVWAANDAGHGDVRSWLRDVMELRLPVAVLVCAVLPSRDLALVLGQRQVSGIGPDCERVELSGQGSTVARRQPDGTWRIAIDAWRLSGAGGASRGERPAPVPAYPPDPRRFPPIGPGALLTAGRWRNPARHCRWPPPCRGGPDMSTTETSKASRPGRRISRPGLRLGGGAAAAVLAGTAGLAATAALVLAGPAGATVSPAVSHGYAFRTLDDRRDVTFNQLLGINKAGVIAGYFGIGSAQHPNKGYLRRPGYSQRDYTNENFPHSVQTQVTGLNNVGNTVGFWANAKGANFGFYTAGRHFHEVNFPNVPNSSPPMDQLLGINDHGIAVGFYQNSAGHNRGYEYNIHTRRYTRILIPGASQGLSGPSLTAAAINNHGEVAGFYVTSTGETVAFVKTKHTFTTVIFPHSSSTQALGINDAGLVVGDYTVGHGASAKMHGFTWQSGHGFHTVNDPKGVNTTTVNGVNDKGELVGFYVGHGGNTNGFLAKP